MIKLENTKVFNFDGAIEGVRQSWGSHARSDSSFNSHGVFNMGQNDRELLMKLSKAGGAHAKFLSQIMVATKITADTVWWAEADTYKIGTVRQSSSTMHTLGKDGSVSMDAFGFDRPDDPLVQKYYHEIILPAVYEWVESGKKKPSYEWRRMIHLNARAFLYTSNFTTNYQSLKKWYHDRKHHRYEEWHQVARWIEEMPYSELIVGEKNEKAE